MKILVAGVGNIFYRDDGFGCEVVRRLGPRPLPEGVTATDFGIRSYDLAYALAAGHDAIVLVDSVPRGGRPGTLYLMEPDAKELTASPGSPPDGHTMNPVTIIQMAQSLGGIKGKLFLVGCEPGTLDDVNGDMVLSEAVEAAVPEAVAMVHSLIGRLAETKPEQEEQKMAGLAPVERR